MNPEHDRPAYLQAAARESPEHPDNHEFGARSDRRADGPSRPWARLGAAILDLVILWIIHYAAAILLLEPGADVVVAIVAVVVVALSYLTVFVATLTATPGMLVMGLFVAHANDRDTPVGLGTAAVRSGAIAIYAIPIVGQFVLIQQTVRMFRTDDDMLHDRLSNTVVVAR